MTSVMIVDDEEYLHDLYREILELKDHKVIATALNGEEAVMKYRELKDRPDLILMDHRMPVKDGLEALKDILAFDPEAQVVFLTADYSVGKQAILNGAADFISKPFQMSVLHEVVDKVAKGLKGGGKGA